MSALAPFLAAAILVVALPDRVATRQVDGDLDAAAARAAGELQSRRADLAYAVAAMDQRALGAAAARGDETAARRLVQDSLRRVQPGSDRAEVDVEVREGRPERASDGVVATYVSVRAQRGPLGLAVVDPSADGRVLRAVAQDRDVDLRLVGPGSRTLETGSRGGDRVERPTRSRTRSVDTTRGLRLEASLGGSPLALLLRARGTELAAAFAMLLFAGMLAATSIVLVMNRALGRVAATAVRMSSGDFDTRLDVVGDDSGARVASSLNDLAAELQLRIGTLEHAVERLDRTLAAIDDGVCAWSADGELETWNAGAEAITGIDAAGARAGGDTVAALRGELTPGRRRVLLPVGDGSKHLAVELSVRRMANGSLLQVFRDAAPAMSIEQARKNFLVTAAHELRTPLTSILGFAATLADEALELGPDVRRLAIAQVLADAERLDATVDALFESSLLARDKLEVAIGRVPIATAIDAAVEQTVADDLLASVELDVQPGAAVRADGVALVRVLGSLIDNALKYGAAPVRVAAAPEGDRVRIAVRDHGSGIPPELQEAVFEPFFRIDPEMRSEVGGAGMGLYTARRLVEAMGGTLVIDSTRSGADGAATVLTILLPSWAGSTASTTADRAGSR